MMSHHLPPRNSEDHNRCYVMMPRSQPWDSNFPIVSLHKSIAFSIGGRLELTGFDAC